MPTVYPAYGLTVGADGALYGTGFPGGANGRGGVYRLGLDSAFCVVASFPPLSSGQRAALTLGSDNRLYGAAANFSLPSFVYRVDPGTGFIDTLYEFSASSSSNGSFPQGRLLEVPQSPDQEIAFVGVTQVGGAYGGGVVYRIDVAGDAATFSKLHEFGADMPYLGETPMAGLVRDADGTLYGTTYGYGAFGGPGLPNSGELGTIYSIAINGEVAKLIGGVIAPWGPLLIGQDGNLYGTSYTDSTVGGSLFRVNLPGRVKTTPTITWLTPADIPYGTALGPAQLNARADVDGTLAYSPSTGTYLGAGVAQTLSVDFSPTDTDRYLNANATTHINVTAATLQVTPDDQIKIVGAPNPALTYAASGFVLGDTPADISGAPAISTTATTASPVGTYPITALLGTLSAANYSFELGGASLKVVYAAEGSTCLGQPGHAVLSPINADGSSIFKRNSSVAVKFRVCDANGTSIGTSGVVSAFNLVQVVAGTASQVVNETVDATNPEGAFRWDASGQQWIFHIATRNLSADKTYVYRITLNDASAIELRFGLK